MSLTSKLLSASGGVDKLYVDDVFSAYTYTGNGATQTINNGIDLAGKGGLVWCKARSVGNHHRLFDTNRGVGKALYSSLTSAQGSDATELTAFNTDGFSLGSGDNINGLGATNVSWTFRKAPKFFDVVTYTGNNVAGRQIPHELGVAPGMIIVKRTDSAEYWWVYHRSNSAGALILNTTDAGNAATPLSTYFGATPTDTVFTTGSGSGLNNSGASYVAYLFAHDDSTDGIIKCGSYTGNGVASGQLIDLGWETQYTIIKKTNGTGDWWINDVSRGFAVNGSFGGEPTLQANLSNAESNQVIGEPNASGFIVNNNNTNQSGDTYIYIAIRRPNKPPTVGTEVYNAIARTGTGRTASDGAAGSIANITGVGFSPDLTIINGRQSQANGGTRFFDRLRGLPSLKSNVSAFEESLGSDAFISHNIDGITLGKDGSNMELNFSARFYINYFFKRAVGVFDVVCYTGTGSARAVQHGLGVPPELMIIKSRTSSSTLNDWIVYSKDLPIGRYSILNNDSPYFSSSTVWDQTRPTSSVFSVGGNDALNVNNGTFVAYLFASKAGISSCFSYTGNGSSQTIDCGFTTGARFVMIKRTDLTGDWLVGDSTRGIVDASDPRLSLNTTVAEVTNDDWLDTNVLGFVVNQTTASNANVSGTTYIGLSFA